ncbi:hypothetical protein FC34_GL000845 [Lacticaseibacillus brantae DSM 23927]|uniref:Transcriptional regulator TetR C-terminal Firmicutes type domain-containing protein n=2 Tax=Lacticaseibacillus brantae TaxID=943673 RepID=A0A0R2AZD3_9LACO|nr:hypothetical protein FC34_GL000845 [Lacticaseibacillus brantae DSM 23927]
MFKLYTDYIDGNPELLARHINDLSRSLIAATGIADDTIISSILQAFSCFSTSAFAPAWNNQTRNQFEAVWSLVRPGVQAALYNQNLD